MSDLLEYINYKEKLYLNALTSYDRKGRSPKIKTLENVALLLVKHYGY